MPGKAKTGKQTLFTLQMADNYFSAIKTDLDKHADKLNAILAVVNHAEVERREVKSTLWDHERRIFNLEHKTA